MKRILLWGWYGFENLGDDLLLDTMLQHLQGEITVPMNKSYKLQRVNEIPRSYKNLVMGAFRNDVLIIGPGGLFPFDNKTKVLLYYIISGIWKALGRRVVFFGIGISEQMSNFSAALWRRMSQRADLFFPRSEKVLDRIGVDETDSVHSMADTVFASDLIKEGHSAESDRVVISIANLQPDNEKAFMDMTEKWIEVIKALVDKGFTVDLIAFTKGNDDRMINTIISSGLLSPLIERGRVRPIYYKDAAAAVRNCKQYKFAICMRFHSLVLSILAGVPAVPIAYGHKTLSLAEMCGLKDYTLIWNTFQDEYYGELIDVSSEQIINKVDKMSSDILDIGKMILGQREKLVGSASNAFQQLDDILK